MIFDPDEDEDIEREPRTLPDFFIDDDAVCGVCGVKNSRQKPLEWVCSVCGEATHAECGADTEPSGGWDRDYDVNYWVCNTCLGTDDPDHCGGCGEEIVSQSPQACRCHENEE